MKKYKLILFSFLFCFISSQVLFSQTIIPQPVKYEIKEGYFELNERTILAPNSEKAYQDALIFNDYLKSKYDFELKIVMNSAIESNVVMLDFIPKENLPAEGYELSIGKYDIRISGNKINYGIQTFKQLLSTEKTKVHNIPCLYILDYPRFPYRGMHLDVCRHFFPKEFVKEYIDYLAMYKMNYFHWHLTDDQGWRIEIKKYPKLTEVGAWRKGTLIGSYRDFPHKYDTITYGGFYTQEDIKEVVKYAEERHITIIPEIEMPGHSLAALASYPEYSCTGGPFEVAREWGVFDDVFCPREETFKFLEEVLSEVIELFPGKYVHIGGDEVPKTRWKKCKHCQEVIQREGLKDENELQSYFVKRIEKFINSKGKTVIGWDEILEGGIAPNATIMSWRGTEGGIEAAKQKHYAIMTPGGYCYFDHYQGDPRTEPLAIGGYTTIEKVYSYEPVPAELTLEEQNYIVGAQGNLWTEYIPDSKQVEYMVFPRIAALSEVLWSPKENRNYTDFKIRLIKHFEYLKFLGINYSKVIYDIGKKIKRLEENDGIALELTPPSDEGKIYYSEDGSEPGRNSKKYTSPVQITKSVLFKSAYFENDSLKGNTYSQQFYFNKATGKPITLVNQPSENYNNGGALTLVDGIHARIPWYGKEWLGFSGKNMEAIIDFGEIQSISKVTVGVLNDENSWIYLPKEIEIYASSDTINFILIRKAGIEDIVKQNRSIKINFDDIKTRYVKVKVLNAGKIQEGKPGAGYDAWLFVDEIEIE